MKSFSQLYSHKIMQDETHIVATGGSSVDIADWGRKESATVGAPCSAAKYGVVRGVDGLYNETVEMLDVRRPDDVDGGFGLGWEGLRGLVRFVR